jgi:imidazolonepropionase-like amidohydrolase
VDGGDVEVTREITPEFDVLRAVDWRARAFREAMLQGVTTAVVFPGDDAVIAGPAGAAKTAGEPNGGRAFARNLGLVANLGTAPGAGNRARSRPDSIYVRQPTNRMGVVWMMRATFRKAAGDAASPYAEVLSGKRPLFVTAHVDADIDAMLRLAGEFQFKPILFGGEEAPQAAARLAKDKVPVVLDAVSTSPSPGAEGADPFWNQAGVLHRAGVSVAIAGDRPLDKARFAARYGMPADAALAAVTSTPAKILGIDGRVGSIAEGKDADLVAFDGEPLEFVTSIRWTAVAGVIPASPPRNPKARSEKGDNE